MKRKTIILAVVAAAAMAITTTINSYLMHESKFKRGKQKTGK